jgi:hypothetical protein
MQPAGKMPKANFRSHGWSCLFGTSWYRRRSSMIRHTSSASYTRADFPPEQQSPVIVTSGKLDFPGNAQQILVAGALVAFRPVFCRDFL